MQQQRSLSSLGPPTERLLVGTLLSVLITGPLMPITMLAVRALLSTILTSRHATPCQSPHACLPALPVCPQRPGLACSLPGGELTLCWQSHMLLQSSMMLLLLQGVCHRDLKLRNTLLDGQPAPRLKICDFGYSKVRACLAWTIRGFILSTAFRQPVTASATVVTWQPGGSMPNLT